MGDTMPGAESGGTAVPGPKRWDVRGGHLEEVAGRRLGGARAPPPGARSRPGAVAHACRHAEALASRGGASRFVEFTHGRWPTPHAPPLAPSSTPRAPG